MNRLWSPWRAAYVADANTSTDRPEAPSVFAAIAADDADEDNLVLWRGEHVFVVMNRYPYNNGHLLIVPYRVVAAYDALTTAEQRALAAATDRCIRWLRTALQPDGFNVGMNLGRAAGAGIPDHLHRHVLPRWAGDTNFMTATSETRVLPESLRDTYQRLRAAIDAEDTSDGASSPTAS
ncbi:HIT family protein [Salisaeta longa]|uniref:HIT family protein n=1 Tax=Salisaeta longa TaxID=503170 RepID=UPI00049077AB|nr:HIT domain-containing protein [Salisaeta longa]